MNTFWIIHDGIFIFRNFIMNTSMVEEIRDIAEQRSGGNTLFNFEDDRRSDFREYYDFPTKEQYDELARTVA